MGDVHRGETTNVMYAGRIAEVGGPGDHVKTVHQGIFINCGLRSFGLTFRTSRFARQVPQLAALALHTAGFTVRPKLVWLPKFNCVKTVPRGNGHISGTVGTTSSGFFVDGGKIQI